MTSQPGATDNHSLTSTFVRKHFALLLGGVPLALAGIRLVVVSQGDYAVMAALIQTLNLSTVVMFTVTTVGPIAVFYLLLALATGGGDWVPRQNRWQKYWVFACAAYALGFLVFVAWYAALSLIVVGAVLTILGVVGRRLTHGLMPIISLPFLGLGLVFATLLQTGLWLPLERITLKDGNTRVGYVLNAADPNPSDPMTILWREGGLVYINPGDLKNRQPCNDGSRNAPGLNNLRRNFTPNCPVAKVQGS